MHSLYDFPSLPNLRNHTNINGFWFDDKVRVFHILHNKCQSIRHNLLLVDCCMLSIPNASPRLLANIRGPSNHDSCECCKQDAFHYNTLKMERACLLQDSLEQIS